MSSVRVALPRGWRVQSVGLERVDRSVSGRTLSAPLWAWSVALVGPRKAVRRAAGRSRRREWALKRLQRAAWGLTGARRGLNPRPGRAIGTSKGAPLVVLACGGWLWTAGSRASTGDDAARCVRRLGLVVRPGSRWTGPAAVLDADQGVWLVRIGRSQRDLCRKLATDARPPLGPDKPFRPPLLRRWERVWPAPSDDAGAHGSADGADDARPEVLEE